MIHTPMECWYAVVKWNTHHSSIHYACAKSCRTDLYTRSRGIHWCGIGHPRVAVLHWGVRDVLMGRGLEGISWGDSILGGSSLAGGSLVGSSLVGSSLAGSSLLTLLVCITVRVICFIW